MLQVLYVVGWLACSVFVITFILWNSNWRAGDEVAFDHDEWMVILLGPIALGLLVLMWLALGMGRLHCLCGSAFYRFLAVCGTALYGALARYRRMPPL